jgi:voltage-gated potassium channel
VTTVGYGDRYPITQEGRYIAVGLMIAGISLIGLITASLASWLVERVSARDEASQAATRMQVEELAREIRELKALLLGADPTAPQKPAADRNGGAFCELNPEAQLAATNEA